MATSLVLKVGSDNQSLLLYPSGTNALSISTGIQAYTGAASNAPQRYFSVNGNKDYKLYITPGAATSTFQATSFGGTTLGTVTGVTTNQLLGSFPAKKTCNIFFSSTGAVAAETNIGTLTATLTNTFNSVFPEGFISTYTDPAVSYNPNTRVFTFTNFPLVAGTVYNLGYLTAAASATTVTVTSTVPGLSSYSFNISVTEGQNVELTASTTATVSGTVSFSILNENTEQAAAINVQLGPDLFATIVAN
jgi:hypothetical protein